MFMHHKFIINNALQKLIFWCQLRSLLYAFCSAYRLSELITARKIYVDGL